VLLNLINEMLLDYDGVSYDTLEALFEYLTREDASETEQKLYRVISARVKSANQRFYITEPIMMSQDLIM
jgi:hypothetical protein